MTQYEFDYVNNGDGADVLQLIKDEVKACGGRITQYVEEGAGGGNHAFWVSLEDESRFEAFMAERGFDKEDIRVE